MYKAEFFKILNYIIYIHLSFDGSAGVSFPRSTVPTSARPDLLRNPWPS